MSTMKEFITEGFMGIIHIPGPQSASGLLIYNFASLKAMSFPALNLIGRDFLFTGN